jgi:hypothetical protein
VLVHLREMRSLSTLQCDGGPARGVNKFGDLSIVAGYGIDAMFRDPGSIDPDRGSGTRADRRGS